MAYYQNEQGRRKSHATRIISARITPMPRRVFDPMPTVYVVYEGGLEKKLFSFLPEEIRFVPEEFLGLTEKEALALYRQKDLAYVKGYPRPAPVWPVQRTAEPNP